MSSTDEPDPDTDPFQPPAIPTIVGCLHCQQVYDSYRIEWRIKTDTSGKVVGFWCCPIPGCDGIGFGFDILPVDPNYRDERGGWVNTDEESEDEDDWEEVCGDFDSEADTGNPRDPNDNDPLPW